MGLSINYWAFHVSWTSALALWLSHFDVLVQSFVATGHFFAGKGQSFPTLEGMELILTCSKCVVTEAFWGCPHVNDS